MSAKAEHKRLHSRGLEQMFDAQLAYVGNSPYTFCKWKYEEMGFTSLKTAENYVYAFRRGYLSRRPTPRDPQHDVDVLCRVLRLMDVKRNAPIIHEIRALVRRAYAGDVSFRYPLI